MEFFSIFIIRSRGVCAWMCAKNSFPSSVPLDCSPFCILLTSRFINPWSLHKVVTISFLSSERLEVGRTLITNGSILSKIVSRIFWSGCSVLTSQKLVWSR